MGENYCVWNSQNEFNYDAIPKKYVKSNKKSLMRRNKFDYQRKLPYGNQPMKLHGFL